MNKILEYTYCKCNDDDTILRIVAGNDFTLRLQLTQKDGELIVPYDLSEAEDLVVNVVTPDGDRFELDSYIDNNIVFAVVDAQQLGTYTPYGIEVIWFDEPYDKRAAAPNLFCFVNSSREANDAQDIIIEGPYDYNLEILSDVAYVSVGEIPEVDLSDYYTKTEIDTTLSSYVQLTELQNMSYATKQYVDDSISHIDLTNYYTKSESDTLMSAYLEYDEFENYAYTISYAANDLNSRVSYLENQEIDLSSYVTYDYLSSMAYVQQSHLYDNIYTKGEVDTKDAQERNYVTNNYYNKSDINTKLNSYVNGAQYDSANHNILLQNGTTTIATIDASPFIIDGMVENVVVNNGNLVISFNTDAGKQDITIPISQIFDASLYYTKTEIDNQLDSYLLIDDFNNYGYAMAYTLLDHKLSLVSTYNNLYNKFNDYYTKTESDTRYTQMDTVKQWTATYFVTTEERDNMTYATAYVLNDLNGRVAYIEEHGSGGDVDLSSYVKFSELEAMSYVNHTELNNASYVSSTDADNIVLLTQSEYDTLVTNDDVNPDTLYYITDATSNYVSYSALEAMSYLRQEDIDAMSYVTSDDLTNASYATESYVGSYVDALDSRVTYLEEHGGGGGGDVDLSSYVSYTDWDNSNEAVAYFITNQTLFNQNLYTKQQVDTIVSSYATMGQVNLVLQNYVSTTVNESQNQAIAYAISYLNDMILSIMS